MKTRTVRAGRDLKRPVFRLHSFMEVGRKQRLRRRQLGQEQGPAWVPAQSLSLDTADVGH